MITLLNTRPQQQAIALSNLLRNEHIDFVEYPTLIIEKIDFSVKKCPRGVFFISRNAVIHFLSQISNPQDYFKQATVYAIGNATNEALAAHGISAISPPPPFNSLSMLKQLPDDLAGQDYLIIKGQGGLDDLANGLIKKKARVTEIACYKRVASPFNDGAWFLFEQKKNGVILIASLDSIESLFATIPVKDQINLRKKTAIVFSVRIKEAMIKQGWLGDILVTKEQSNQMIINTIKTIEKRVNHDIRK